MKISEKNEEIEKISEAIMEAIPVDVEMVNIIIALNDLAREFTWELTNDDDIYDEDEDHLMSGTNYSAN